ncbi:MAG: 50S ribosomal protein L13, partial [Chloroflexi bacterium]|nr:50S ribosomal protein L13 [Chloroflexota bacterium]
GERLGRLATKVAGLLQGKHRPDYSRHQLSDDFVIVVNAAKVGVSGNKLSQKLYYRHSGYLGGMRTRTLEEMLTRFPERVIELAVKGMLPRNRLGRRMLRRLKVYTAATHPHEAQVRIGMGKAKQAPAVPAPTPARRRRRAVREETAAEEEAPQAVVEAEAVEEAAPAEEEPQTAVAEAEETAVDDSQEGEPETEEAAEGEQDEESETK